MSSDRLDNFVVVTSDAVLSPNNNFYDPALKSFDQIRTSSEKMLDVIEAAKLYARSEISILLHGESGTGKELFAQYIHQNSARKGRRIVTVNAAALPETLAEALLFGYEKGAFTGASSNKEGLIEAANGGTLFLDEVGDLPLSIQTKLLRVVQNRVVLRVGSTTEREVDIRFIFASHRDVSEMVEQGTFREDLFYRIQEVLVDIPPLRERGEDSILLARSFAKRFGADMGLSDMSLSADAERAIAEHVWPGNVRELQSAIRRAVILCRSCMITAKHLQIFPARIPGAPSGRLLPVSAPPTLTELPVNVATVSHNAVSSSLASMAEMRRDEDTRRVLSALERVNGNVSRAASLLGISRPTVYNILKRSNGSSEAAA